MSILAELRRMDVIDRMAEAGLLTPASVGSAARTLAETGLNLFALARFAAHRFHDAPAIAGPEQSLSFRQLADQAEAMAAVLRAVHGARRRSVVGVLCRNGTGFVLALFAASRLGCRVMLLNPDLSAAQLAAQIERHRITVVICEADMEQALQGSSCAAVQISYLLERSEGLSGTDLPPISGGELVVLTGGTTGAPKASARKPAPANFALIFAHLVTALELDRYSRCYVAVPLSHGYGVAAFLVALALGRTVHLAPRFTAEGAAAMVRDKGVEVLAVVPAMLQRLLAVPGAGDLPIKRVITGGAALAPSLAMKTRALWGDVLFNLYGTSEAGVSLMATPGDLAEHPNTVGRELWGVDVEVLDGEKDRVGAGEVGRLVIRSRAAAGGKRWVDTGDLASRDGQGRIFLHGRADEMISSGGEKVHPWEVEVELMRHPEVREAACVGVADEAFGQRLLAIAVLVPGSTLSPEALATWLHPRVARFQRPRAVFLWEELPLTPVGKLDKKAISRRLALETNPAQGAGRRS